MGQTEKINTILINSSGIDEFKKNNIGEIAWIIYFGDKYDDVILCQDIPSFSSHDGCWNKDWIYTNEQCPLQIFTIESKNALKYWSYKNIKYSESNEFIIWSLEIAEVGKKNGDNLIRASKQAYDDIHELIQKTGKTILVRFGNYLTDILWETLISIDWTKVNTNRYKAFCVWRSLSLDNKFQLNSNQLPTAIGIWTHLKMKWLKIFFIATNRNDVKNHKNPHQLNPFDYNKRDYWIERLNWNISTPRFNRATSIFWEHILFVWGTASILWQEVVYEWDPIKQTHQSLLNIKYVIEEVEKDTWKCFAKLPIILTVYIKNKHDFNDIKMVIENNNILSNTIINTIYTHGDICRDKCLVEISCETVNPEIAKNYFLK